jgi:hypothetical protein
MVKKSWLLVLPLIATLVWFGAAPSQASGEIWRVKSIDAVGCATSDWDLTVVFDGVDGGAYIAHSLVSSGGLIYMNEAVTYAPPEGAEDPWGLYADSSYGPTTGTWPIPAGQPMKVQLILERPKGTVLSRWTIVTPSCDSSAVTFNAADFDNDLVADGVDACPRLKSSRSNGCPLRDRSLTLKAKYGPKRVVGRLYAPGYPALYAGRTVKIWKVRPGPDLKVATKTTGTLGRFKARVGKGRYYATSPGYIAASAGQAAKDVSPVRRVF